MLFTDGRPSLQRLHPRRAMLLTDTKPDEAATTSSRHELLDSPEFRQLVARRWRVSSALTAVLFVIYYGFIMLVATNKPLLATRVGDVTTLGIPLGVAVIVVSWALTAGYVVWANRHYDPEVRRLRQRID
jgi:uncharacterized membrane protein (DUF485 family)